MGSPAIEVKSLKKRYGDKTAVLFPVYRDLHATLLLTEGLKVLPEMPDDIFIMYLLVHIKTLHNPVAEDEPSRRIFYA
jgi:hypothetical protein